MPVSNGQVTSRDIRQSSVKTLHIVDEAVTTAKIPDLAVTFPDKIDDPIWVSAFREVLFTDESLTVFPDVFDFTTTVDVPAWVDNVSVFADPTFQLTNTSGSDILMSISTFIDGGEYGFTSHEAVNNQTQSLQLSYGADITGVAGASVTVGMRILIQGASNSDNVGIIAGLMIGRR